MVCTFPGVFAFQLIAAPVAIAALLIALLVRLLLDPAQLGATENPIIIGTFIAVFVFDFVFVAGMSCLGFSEGWRAGWQVARGRPLRAVIAQSPSVRFVDRLWRGISGGAKERARELQ